MPGKRIAMWSGPRNISTALMRSWGSRSDTYVSDEPFYANYLRERDVAHPGRDEVIEAYPDPWEKVAARLTGPIPEGKNVWYQKHMSHHLLPGMEGPWLEELTNVFLIRDPALVINSFSRVVSNPGLEDLGLEQQVSLFNHVRESTGSIPLVVDSEDLLRNPPEMLKLLCDALDVMYDDAMLRWEPGVRRTDGVWARHWYGSVQRSTGFQPWEPKDVHLEGEMKELEMQCRPLYETLASHRLTV